MYKEQKSYIHLLSKSKALIYVFTFLLNTFAMGQLKDTSEFSQTELPPSISAYQSGTTSKLDLTKDLKSQLLPLDTLIAITQAYSPIVMAQESLIAAGEDQVKLSRREWQNGVFVSFNQSMGNQTLFYDSNLDPTGTQSQSVNSGYRLAFNLNVPLYWFSARNAKVDIARNELLVRSKTKDKMRQDVAKEVIYEYNNLLTTHNVLLIASNAKGTARMLADLANKQFAQSDITISDYAGILAIASKADSDYEIAKRDFYIWYQQFENLTGRKLENLIR